MAISLVNCGLAGDSGGRVASSVIRAHAARREEMVWSAGLRRPSGVVGNTAAAAPSRISTAGCLSMDLSGNRLGDAGVRAVARGLQSDTWLVSATIIVKMWDGNWVRAVWLFSSLALWMLVVTASEVAVTSLNTYEDSSVAWFDGQLAPSFTKHVTSDK